MATPLGIEMTFIVSRVTIGRKFDQVVQGARAIFMRDGFDGASVDDIARAAGVSKATLYKYFPDKRLLFSEVARKVCCEHADNAVAEIDRTAPPRQVLRQAGLHIIRFNLSDFGVELFRISVGESGRFPDVGREFHQCGPMVVERALVDYFDEATERGDLVIGDKPLAANQFAELCKADLFPRRLFGQQSRFSEKEIDRVVDGAVDMFIARYGAT